MPDLPPEPKGNVKLFGLSIPSDKERKFILIASAIGIGGVLLLALRSKAASSTSSTAGTTSGATASGTDPSAVGAVSTPLPTVEFRFSESTSPTVAGGGSSSGGGGLSFAGFSIGGSGGKNSQNGLSVQNTFSADTIVSNADQGTIASIETWLTGLAGTQADRAYQAQTEINQYQTAVKGGKTPNSPYTGVIA